MSSPIETDVIVLGVGTCGEDASLQLLDAGLEVVGVEAALVGGECPYWACLPSKRLLRNAKMLAEARRADGVAGRVSVEADWSLVARQVRTEVTGGWDDAGAVERFAKRGGVLVRGHGRLHAPREVTVGSDTYRARRGVIIATGSHPVMPHLPGITEADPWTNHELIAAESLPASLVVLGGGVVGCELGQLMARFGVAVSIVESADRLLPSEEPEASAVLADVLGSEGVEIHTGVAASAAEAGSVTLTDGRDLSADRILVAAGRRPTLDDLGLEVVGLDPEAGSIATDEHMRAADGLWAIGDVTARGMLTHVALRQGAVAVADILERPHAPARYDAVPRVAFTDPEVASVGLTETAAREAGLEPVVVVKQLGATFRGWLHRDGNAGFVKLILDPSRGRLVGATSVGPDGGEVLGLLSLAIHARVPLAELRTMVYAFPTLHGAIGEAIGAYGRGVTTVLDPTYEGVALLDQLGRRPPTSSSNAHPPSR